VRAILPERRSKLFSSNMGGEKRGNSVLIKKAGGTRWLPLVGEGEQLERKEDFFKNKGKKGVVE